MIGRRERSAGPRRDTGRTPATTGHRGGIWSRIVHGALAVTATGTAGLSGVFLAGLLLLLLRQLLPWRGPNLPAWYIEIGFWTLVVAGGALGCSLALLGLEVVPWRRARYVVLGAVLALAAMLAGVVLSATL